MRYVCIYMCVYMGCVCMACVYSHVCIYRMYVYVCVYIWDMCIYKCVYIWGTCVYVHVEATLGIFLSNAIPYFLKPLSLYLELCNSDSLAGQQVPRDPVPSVPVLELQTQVTTPGSLSGCQGSTDVFTLAQQGVYLFTEPSPHPGAFLP